MRERAVHCSFLQLIDHIPCDSFLTALLTPDINMNYSVHTHHSTLYRTQLGILEPVALKFANLHSTSSVAYRKLPGYLTGSDQLERIASSHRYVTASGMQVRLRKLIPPPPPPWEAFSQEAVILASLSRNSTPNSGVN